MNGVVLYKLEIYTNNFQYTALGGTEMEAAFNQYRDGAYSSAKRFSVSGFSDNAMRTPLEVCIDPETIVGMELTRA